MSEAEITREVALCRPDGTLDAAAVGWTRRPLHDTSGVGRGLRGRGRTKRWEYWALVTPRHVVGVTTSALDYAALHQVHVLDKHTGAEVDEVVVAPFNGTALLPGSLGRGPVRSRTRRVAVAVDEAPDGRATRLRARTSRVDLDVVVERPAGHESLGVVVPWSSRRFQYTVKDIGRPALGVLRLDDVEHRVDTSAWAVLDHGRGRWPYSATWQWGVGYGASSAGPLGLQLGGTWTRPGPTTENGLFVDGRLHKIHDELDWSFDRSEPLAPWRVRGDRVGLTFTPFHDRVARTNLGILASATDQCFGHWSGTVRTDDGEPLAVDDLEGWAEDVHQRW